MLWFGDPDIPTELDREQVTDQYLAGAVKFIERRLISRTGGLLELHGYSKDPRHLRVEFMLRQQRTGQLRTGMTFSRQLSMIWTLSFGLFKARCYDARLLSIPSRRGMIF